MTKIDIISGFLGAGKTTLIKRLLADALKGEQVVLIENEFGEIGIDGGFLKDAGIVVNEMNAGCICCSLVGDFGKALHDVVDQYHPDRILIEPSGVGKLSDVIAAVQNAHLEVQLNSFVTVVDALKAKMYLKNFGEFFENQVAHAGAILLSRTAECPEKRLDETVAMLRGLNEHARIVTTPWKDLTGEQLLSTMEGSRDLVAEVLEEIAHEPHHEHHHHHHDHEHDEHEHEHDHEHESTSIITSTMSTAPAAATITTMSMSITTIMTTSTIITTTTVTAAAVTTTITMLTKYSPPGVRKRLTSTPRQSLTRLLPRSAMLRSAPYCVQRASFRVQTAASGCTLTTFRAHPKSAAALPITPAVCASSAPSWMRSASLLCSA